MKKLIMNALIVMKSFQVKKPFKIFYQTLESHKNSINEDLKNKQGDAQDKIIEIENKFNQKKN